MNKLQDVAVLVSFGVRSYAGTKDDQALRKELADANRAEEDEFKVKKRLVSKKAIDRFKKIETKAWSYHYEKTIRWKLDEALLVNELASEYIRQMDEYKDQWTTAKNTFLNEWTKLIDDQRARLGTAWNRADYPTALELMDKFSWRLDIRQIEGTGAHEGKLGALIERTAQARTKEMMLALWRRLFDALARMIERLSKADAVFRNSLCGNIDEVLAIAKGLHLDDPELLRIQEMVTNALAGIEPDMLRESPEIRAITVRRITAAAKALEPITGLNTEATVRAIRAEMDAKPKKPKELDEDAPRPIRKAAPKQHKDNTALLIAL